MRTAQWTGVVALVSLLLFLGLAVPEIRLLALVLPLVAYLAFASIFRPDPPRIEASRSVDRVTVFEGDRPEIRIRIANKGPALEFLEVYDPVPAEAEVVEGSNYLVVQLLPEEVQEFRYAIHLPVKGQYEVGPLEIRSRDLLGFFVHQDVAADAETITTSPRRIPLRSLDLPARSTRPWLGQIPSRRAGSGTDFWAIRDYVSGDSLRRINWKASGRLDTLLSNEYEGEHSADYVLVLDAREEAAHGPVGGDAVEMGVRASASLAAKLLEERNRVGIIVLRSVLDWVYPGFGRRQLNRLVEALVSVRPGGEWTLGHLPWVLDRFFPARSELIVITPLVDHRTRDAVAEYKARGHGVVVLSPSMIDLEAEFLGTQSSWVRVATRLLRLEREANLARLRRIAPVADWKPDQPLPMALKEVEARRPIPAR